MFRSLRTTRTVPASAQERPAWAHRWAVRPALPRSTPGRATTRDHHPEPDPVTSAGKCKGEQGIIIGESDLRRGDQVTR